MQTSRVTEVPRLLVATEFPPNASGGGPAVVRQVLKHWPAERISWWSCFPDRDQRFRQKVSAHDVATVPPRFYPNRRWARQKSWLMDKIWVPRAARHFQQTLNQLAPDVLWIIPHAWSIPAISTTLESTKIAFHITVQDYMDAQSYVRRFGPARCDRWARTVDRLYALATTRDATSHPMISDLKTRTGCDAAQMLHAGIEPEDFEFLIRRPPRARVTIKIAYAGTILTPEEFGFFVGALKRLKPTMDVDISLNFFGFHSYAGSSWFDKNWMHEHGNLAEPELLAVLRECDWGFSPMSLQDDDPRYNHFSFPTKFISYLAAGLPAITMGHPQASIVQMATEYRVGLCSNTRDIGTLTEQLKKLFSVADPWQEFGPEILRCARIEFDAQKKRERVYECLRFCAGQTRKKEAVHG